MPPLLPPTQGLGKSAGMAERQKGKKKKSMREAESTPGERGGLAPRYHPRGKAAKTRKTAKKNVHLSLPKYISIYLSVHAYRYRYR